MNEVERKHHIIIINPFIIFKISSKLSIVIFVNSIIPYLYFVFVVPLLYFWQKARDLASILFKKIMYNDLDPFASEQEELDKR